MGISAASGQPFIFDKVSVSKRNLESVLEIERLGIY